MEPNGSTTSNRRRATAWRTDTITNTNNEGYNVVVSVSCDHEGEEGMFMVEWAGEYTYTLFEFFPMNVQVTSTLTPARKYLSPEWALDAGGAEGSWEYAYELMIIQESDGKQPEPLPTQVSGTYYDAGTHQITLFDGTEVTAYKLTNDFLLSNDIQTLEGHIEQYWVKGLGMVREVFEDQTAGTELLTKELSSYSGLSIIED